eukprot:738543-Lingulodinium_polyedra.AAC.1
MPVREEGDMDVAAVQAAQALAPPPTFRERGHAGVTEAGPGSVLVQGPAPERFASAIARAQQEAVNFAFA